MCICFLPAIDKDLHKLCAVCHDQRCSVELKCAHCKDWPIEWWGKVQTHIDKLAEWCERNKERKAQSKSSYSSGFFILLLLLLLTTLIPSSYGVGRSSLPSPFLPIVDICMFNIQCFHISPYNIPPSYLLPTSASPSLYAHIMCFPNHWILIPSNYVAIPSQSAFSGFSILHQVLLMVSELSPRPGLSWCNKLLSSS